VREALGATATLPSTVTSVKVHAAYSGIVTSSSKVVPEKSHTTPSSRPTVGSIPAGRAGSSEPPDVTGSLQAARTRARARAAMARVKRRMETSMERP
jgi:hypothetical protein